MAELFLSEGEKTFIVHGIQHHVRLDGRDHEDYRCMELETDMIPQSCGSARLRLANTDVLVSIKAEISEPLSYKPNQGCLNFFVDCSANATPSFEGRGGEALGESISCMLANVYSEESTIDLKKLCISPGKKCWRLYVDILILEVGGNLYDAVSLAVKAALYNARIPNLTVAGVEHGEADVEVSDDPFNCFQLDVKNAPCLVTINKVKDCYIVDATMEEESCITARLIMGVLNKEIVTGIEQEGFGSLSPSNIIKVIEIGKRVGTTLNERLMRALHKEKSVLSLDTHLKCSFDCGFLR